MKYLTLALVFFCGVSSGLLKELPKYIDVCKRDQSTIDSCVLKSIEALKPQLVAGIPEIDVPPIDPFIIQEIKPLPADGLNLRTSLHNVQITGAADFKIKSLSVDVDKLTVRVRVRIPKLHFKGQYILDGQLLIVALKGAGEFTSEALKCDTELVIHPQVVQKDGVDYLKFNKIDVDISVKDYRVRLDGLFDGDKTLGEATNAAINENRSEFLKVMKPHVEKTVSKHLLDIANKVVDGLTLDQLLPKP